MKSRELLTYITSIIWVVSELALAVIVFSILVFILLGESSGSFVSTIVENCSNLLKDIGAESIIGVSIVVFAYLYLIKRNN